MCRKTQRIARTKGCRNLPRWCRNCATSSQNGCVGDELRSPTGERTRSCTGVLMSVHGVIAILVVSGCFGYNRCRPMCVQQITFRNAISNINSGNSDTKYHYYNYCYRHEAASRCTNTTSNSYSVNSNTTTTTTITSMRQQSRFRHAGRSNFHKGNVNSTATTTAISLRQQSRFMISLGLPTLYSMQRSRP